MFNKIFVPIFYLFLMNGGVLSCAPSKTKSSEAPPSMSWGQHSWKMADQAVEVRLNRTSLGVNAKLQIHRQQECRSFDVKIGNPQVTAADNFQIQWIVISPTGPGRPCVEVNATPTMIRPEDLQSIYSGQSQTLSFSGAFELTEEEWRRNPDVKLQLNMGTRSLLVTNHELAAIVDTESKEFAGVAIKAEWLTNHRSDASFPLEQDDRYLITTMLRDAHDEELNHQRQRLHCFYQHPRWALNYADAKQGLVSSIEAEQGLLRAALQKLQNTTEECQ